MEPQDTGGSREMSDYIAPVRGVAMLKQIDPLPRPKTRLAVRDGDCQAYRQYGRLDMG